MRELERNGTEWISILASREKKWRRGGKEETNLGRDKRREGGVNRQIIFLGVLEKLDEKKRKGEYI